LAQFKGFVAKNNTTFRLKDVKELTYTAFGKITKDVWTKAEQHVVKIEKEYSLMNWQTHVPNIFGIVFNVTFIRFLHLFSVYYT
jgi:hypothetical protein